MNTEGSCVLAGILLGLAAALAQSISYFCTRLFVIRRHQGVLRLLVLGHLIMAAASAALLPAVWPVRWPPPERFGGYLAGAAAFYFLGQVGMFYALRHTDASRASPLLGLKIVVLAAITVLALHQHLSALEWLGCLVGVAAAMVLGVSGGPVGWRALGGLLFAIVTYSLSDINITHLVRAMDTGQGILRSSLLAVFLSYTACGLIGLALWPTVRRRGGRGDWLYASPFAASWLVAMMLLFACFGTIDVVLGNIVQSSRGLMTIAIGTQIAAAGMVHLERRTSWTVLLQRIGAAALMVLAVGLIVAGREQRTQTRVPAAPPALTMPAQGPRPPGRALGGPGAGRTQRMENA